MESLIFLVLTNALLAKIRRAEVSKAGSGEDSGKTSY